MSEEEIRREHLGNIVIFTVIFALLSVYAWKHSAYMDAILDCMAEKGSVHSEVFYDECAYELS